jgi:hypothetical protein
MISALRFTLAYHTTAKRYVGRLMRDLDVFSMRCNQAAWPRPGTVACETALGIASKPHGQRSAAMLWSAVFDSLEQGIGTIEFLPDPAAGEWCVLSMVATFSHPEISVSRK